MRSIVYLFLIVSLVVLGLNRRAEAVEMKMHNGVRFSVLVEGFDPATGKVTVYLANGDQQAVLLRSIATIYYSGRSDRFVRTGEQSFIFNAGGHMCCC